MNAERSRLPTEARERAASNVAALLAGLPELVAAAASGRCVAGFAATRAELDPAPALEAAAREGARLAWPRVASEADDAAGVGVPGGARAARGVVDGAGDGDGRNDGNVVDAADVQVKPRLRFHLASRGDLRPGRFGIWEPSPSCPEVTAGEVAVMLVPGLAFDGRGNRLGFGGGYYDEVLAGTGGPRPGFVVGVGYDFQVVDSVPVNDGDARVDCLVTDARVIRCHHGAAILPDGVPPSTGARHSAAPDAAARPGIPGLRGLADGARSRRRKVDP